MHRRLEFSEGSSDKFWEVEVTGETVTVRWGRRGTAGQEKAKTHGSADEALRDAEAQLQGKLKKGYREVAVEGGAPRPAAPKAAPVAAAAAVSAPNPAPATPAPVAAKPTPAAEPPAPVPAVPAATAEAAVQAATALLEVVHWTDAARARLHPVQLPPRPRPDSPEKFLARLGKCLQGGETLHGGLGLTVPTLRGRVKTVLGRLASGGTPPATPDPDEEALMVTVLGLENLKGAKASLLLDYWEALGGLPLAVESLLACTRYTLRVTWTHPYRWVTRAQEPAFPMQAEEPGVFGELRRRVAAASEEEYESARDLAAARRPALDYSGRCLLAYLFPREKAWAEEEARDFSRHVITQWGMRCPPPGSWGLLTCLEDPALAEGVLLGADPRHMPVGLAFSLVDRLGPRAVPLIQKWLDKDVGSEGRRTLAEALALVDSDDLARLFARSLDDRDLRPAASAWLQQHPRRGLGALAAVAAGTGRGRDSARSVLAAMLRSGDLADAVAALPPRERKACEDILARTAVQVPEATAGELPPVLARPPWAEKRKAPDPRVVPGLSTLEREERVDWTGVAKPKPYYYDRPPLDGRRDEEWTKYLHKQLKSSDGNHITMLDRFSTPAAVETWNTLPVESWWLGYYSFLPLLARLDIAGLPGFLAVARRDLSRTMEALERIDSPRVAPFVAEALGRLQKARGAARGWLLRYPETAAVGLVPQAVGPVGKPREWAGQALRLLAAEGRADTVRNVAARYGPQAAEAVEEVLQFDPLLLFPARLPKLPAFWQPDTFPRPLLRDRSRAVPAAALEHLGLMLAISADDPYPGLAQVREACDPETLDEFAWAVFQAWLLAGAPAKEKWAFYGLGWWGGDESARRLAPLIREWPGQSAQARAEMGLEILCRMGSDVALMHLHGMSQRLKYKALQAKARQRIQEMADARGLTPEELADRLVPDLDLEEDGSRTFDFGPRAFRVGFEQDLTPYLADPAGKRLADLPKPGAGDDAAKAEEAAKAWKAFKKDLKTLARDQILRLELAMCSRRRWEASTFRTFLVEHPLMGHLARRLVWGVYGEDGAPSATFRVAEDRTFADASDDEFTLPGEARVGLVHALELSPEEASAWARLLADYRLQQPFVQLGRPVHGLEAGEAEALKLTRFEGGTVATGKVLGLESRGWRRGPIWDSGVLVEMEKPIPGGMARFAMEPGIYAGDIKVNPEQRLDAVEVLGPDDLAIPLGRVDPISFSELVADLQSLGARRPAKK